MDSDNNSLLLKLAEACFRDMWVEMKALRRDRQPRKCIVSSKASRLKLLTRMYLWFSLSLHSCGWIPIPPLIFFGCKFMTHQGENSRTKCCLHKWNRHQLESLIDMGWKFKECETKYGREGGNEPRSTCARLSINPWRRQPLKITPVDIIIHWTNFKLNVRKLAETIPAALRGPHGILHGLDEFRASGSLA